jgi:hypothetical protein
LTNNLGLFFGSLLSSILCIKSFQYFLFIYCMGVYLLISTFFILSSLVHCLTAIKNFISLLWILSLYLLILIYVSVLYKGIDMAKTVKFMFFSHLHLSAQWWSFKLWCSFRFCRAHIITWRGGGTFILCRRMYNKYELIYWRS